MGTFPTDGAQPQRRSRIARLVPAGLIVLGLIPLLANALRRVALSVASADASSGEASAPITVPVLVHIVGAAVFVILGALQFSAALRERRPAWHRIGGRVAVAAGLLAAVSGLWLAVIALPGSSPLLLTFRLLAGTAMLVFIALGFIAVRKRAFQRHGAWMVRAYAIGLGAGTQVFTLGFGELLVGRNPLSVAVLNGLGWIINLAVAEVAIRRGSSGSRRSGRSRAVAVRKAVLS